MHSYGFEKYSLGQQSDPIIARKELRVLKKPQNIHGLRIWIWGRRSFCGGVRFFTKVLFPFLVEVPDNGKSNFSS